MLTNPNTLGLFDENIAEIAGLIHEAGGTLYYDGANLNAVMGHSRPGDMGFDIVHVNLHKSFSQPHGGGGPGAGPIAVSERIEPFLPRPQVVRREGDNGGGPTFDLDHERPKSIGRLRGFQGNFGVFVRSYAYILSLGADGLAEASETAVLNANYLKARLAEGRAGEHLPVAFDRHCMHEFVLSGKPMKRELGIETLDLAKRLLDFGFHPPTVYFPLLVDEALMVEPTETETKETPRRLRRGDRGDPRRGRGRPRDRASRRPTRPRSAASTRSRRPASRSSASRWAAQSSGSFCLSSSTGAKRSPCSSIRSSTSPASKTSVSGSPLSAALLDLVPGDRGRDGRALAGAQRVDGDRRLARWFWDQSTKTLPLRSAFFIFETTSSGSASRAAGRSPGRRAWSRRSWSWRCSAARRPAGPSSPTSSGSTRGRSGRTARAGAARPGSSRRCWPAAPGSRSKASTVGCSAPGASESDGCSSSAASCAIQISVGRSSQTQKSISPAFGPALTVRRLHPLRPVLGAALLEEGGVEVVDALGEAAQGHGAAAQVGDDRRRDLGVVVDHLALGEAGLRVEDLVEVGELQLAPVDLDLRGQCRHWATSSDLASERFFERRLFRRVGLLRLAFAFAGFARLRASCASPLTAAMLSSSAAIRSGALVGFGARRLGGDDLLALGLALDQRQQLLAVLVAVRRSGRSRRSASRSASPPSRPPALRPSASRPEARRRARRGHDLVGEAHRRHRQHAVVGADRRQVLLVAQHEAGDRHLAGSSIALASSE